MPWWHSMYEIESLKSLCGMVLASNAWSESQHTNYSMKSLFWNLSVYDHIVQKELKFNYKVIISSVKWIFINETIFKKQ